MGKARRRDVIGLELKGFYMAILIVHVVMKNKKSEIAGW
jgi:hypothetical protein